ncbi:hypothetical protein [Algibacter mikhailovii]|uniref:hypothetical protein n=1 Tax=Algibacter mikhailovii TaxID=425498 RepID=UPI002493D9A1|nr:hypothetical protein [Algibacter mikhailovii]
MKEKLFTSLKTTINEIPITFCAVFIFSMYLTFISLSLKSNKLLLEELILCGAIIGLALINGHNNNL